MIIDDPLDDSTADIEDEHLQVGELSSPAIKSSACGSMINVTNYG
jgi:hypothetical protein